MEDEFPISPRLARDFGLVPYRTRYYAPKVAQDPARWGLPIPSSHCPKDRVNLEVSGGPPHQVSSKALLSLSPRYPRDPYLSRSTEILGLVHVRPGAAGGRRPGKGVIRTRAVLGADLFGDMGEQERGFVGGMLDGPHSYPRHLQGNCKSSVSAHLLAELSPLSSTTRPLFPPKLKESKLKPIRLSSTPEVEVRPVQWRDLPWSRTPTARYEDAPCQEKRSFRLFRTHRDPPDHYIRTERVKETGNSLQLNLFPERNLQAEVVEMGTNGGVEPLISQGIEVVEAGKTVISVFRVIEVRKCEVYACSRLQSVAIPREAPDLLDISHFPAAAPAFSMLSEPKSQGVSFDYAVFPEPVSLSSVPTFEPASAFPLQPSADSPQRLSLLLTPEPISIQPDLSPICAGDPGLSFAQTAAEQIQTDNTHIEDTQPLYTNPEVPYNSPQIPFNPSEIPFDSAQVPCDSPEIPFNSPSSLVGNLETSADASCLHTSSELTAFQPTAVNSETEVTRQTIDAEFEENEDGIAWEYAQLMDSSIGISAEEDGKRGGREAHEVVRRGKRGRKKRKRRRKEIKPTENSVEMTIPETAEELVPSRGIGLGLYLEDPRREEVWPALPSDPAPIAAEFAWDRDLIAPDEPIGDEDIAGSVAQQEDSQLEQQEIEALDPFEVFLEGFARSLLEVITDLAEEEQAILQEPLSGLSSSPLEAIPPIPGSDFDSFPTEITEFQQVLPIPPTPQSPLTPSHTQALCSSSLPAAQTASFPSNIAESTPVPLESPNLQSSFSTQIPIENALVEPSPHLLPDITEFPEVLSEVPKPQSPLNPLRAQIPLRSTSAKPKKKPSVPNIRAASRRELHRAKARPPPRTKMQKRIALLKQQTLLPASPSSSEENEGVSGLRQRQMAAFELKHLYMLREMAKNVLGSNQIFEEKLKEHEEKMLSRVPSPPVNSAFAHLRNSSESAEEIPVSLALSAMFSGYRAYTPPIFTSPIAPFTRRKQPVLDNYSLAAATEKVEADSENYQSAVRKRLFLNAMELQPDYEIYFAMMASGLTQTDLHKTDPLELLRLWRRTVVRRKCRKDLEMARISKPNVSLKAKAHVSFSNIRLPAFQAKPTHPRFSLQALSANLLPSERVYLRLKKTNKDVFPAKWRSQPGASGLAHSLESLSSL